MSLALVHQEEIGKVEEKLNRSYENALAKESHISFRLAKNGQTTKEKSIL